MRYSVILIFILLSSSAQAVDFYISPTGSDSNPGTSISPFKTFKFALLQLLPGDRLILKDGTYTKITTGLPNIDCAAGVKKGNVSSPITIKAENERKAFLQSNGSVYGFLLTKCSYWNIEGLRISSADLSSGNGGKGTSDPFVVEYSDHINIRRILATNNNRFFNTHTITVRNSTDSLIEDVEAYYFHRHGINTAQSNRVVIRRSYVNSRFYANIPGGYIGHLITSDRGDEGIVLYGSSNSIIENSISEGNGQIAIHGRANNSKILGSIGLNNIWGFQVDSRGTDKLVSNPLLENDVSIGASRYGLRVQGAVNLMLDNFSGFNSNQIGVSAEDRAQDSNSTPILNASIWSENVLADDILLIGSFGGGWKFDYPNSSSYNPLDFVCLNCFSNINTFIPTEMYDPFTGQGCVVYIPNNSNMKGAGKDGADIGANIIYEYQDGVLTTNKLWNQSTGAFPCGAIVSGVNDDDSSNGSCINVHERLNVGVNGCPVP